MNQEKWEQIVGMIKDKFKVEDEAEKKLEDIPNSTLKFIIFLSPLGRIKLEYIIRPVILDKKAIGSRRIGSETKVEYIYSKSEFSHIFKAYKWDEDKEEWIEMEVKKSGFAV